MDDSDDLFGAEVEEVDASCGVVVDDTEDMFGAPVEDNGGDDDMFGAAVEDASTDDMFGAPVEANDDTGATDDMFGAEVQNNDGSDEMFSSIPAEDFTGGDMMGASEAEPSILLAGPSMIEEPVVENQKESARIIWSRKFRGIVDERAAEERKLLLARKEKAAAELKEYMKRREEHKSSTAARNRQEESEFLIQLAEEKDNGNPWSRVVNMIETQAHGDENRTDAKRLRSVLIQLKNKPLKKPAPADE